MLIAASAVRMAVKNRQIVRALRDRDDYSEKAAVAAAREVFRALAREKREDVERLDDIIEHARDRPGRAQHQTDYRKADAELLERREQVSDILADRLDDIADDDEYLHGVVECGAGLRVGRDRRLDHRAARAAPGGRGAHGRVQGASGRGG